MADGVTLSSGNNTSPADSTKFATDDTGAAGHIPIVKLAYSADGDGTLITADANGLKVQVAAGTVTLGGVSSTAVSVSTALAYSTASGTALAANANRVGFNIINVSTAVASVNFGATANSTAMIVARLGSQWDRVSDAQLGLYQGVITIIGSAAGTAVVTEW